VVPAAQMREVVRRDGFLPIEDHGLIGDGSTCALVGRDGGIAWLCIPEFDSPPFLAGILDAENGGVFEMAPVSIRSATQRYMEDSCVLVTSLASDRGMLQITDCLTLRCGPDLVEPVPAGRSELLRHVQAVGGDVRLRIRLVPKAGSASTSSQAAGASSGRAAWFRRSICGLRWHCLRTGKGSLRN
jgi:GH15 family glucan-1,4-alpha-glucosidase